MVAEPDRDGEGVKGKDRERKVSAKVTYTLRVLHKFKKFPPQAELTAVLPHLLPEDLRMSRGHRKQCFGWSFQAQ